MKIYADRLALVSAGMALILSACSPAAYDEQVADFSGGLQQAAAMVEEHRRLENQFRDAARDLELMRDRPPVRLDPDCLDTFAKLDSLIKAGGGPLTADDYARCGLQTRDDNGDWSGDALADSDALNDSMALVAALNAYAQALDAMLSGEGREQFTQSADALGESVASLAGTVENTTGEAVPGPGAIEPLTALIAEAGEIYLENRRFQVMKAVVQEADPIVQTASLHLAQTIAAVNLSNADRARAQLDVASEAFRRDLSEADYQRALDGMTDQHEALLTLLSADPGQVFASMGRSHAALKNAVEDPHTQLSASIESAKDFFNTARDAHEALTDVLAEEG